MESKTSQYFETDGETRQRIASAIADFTEKMVGKMSPQQKIAWEKMLNTSRNRESSAILDTSV